MMADAYAEHNMAGADHLSGWCGICGRPYPERHHVVARSMGGAAGPVVHLGGFGSNLRDADGRLLHHGAAEQHLLHLWWADGTDLHLAPRAVPVRARGWFYLLAEHPVSIQQAYSMGPWRPLQ